MTVDLHLHSTHSDGTWPIAELVEHAVGLKMKHIAITDHDTVAGIDEAQTIARGRLEIIPGVEINTRSEIGTAKRQDIHILGYFIDHKHPRLLTLLAEQREARHRHVEKLLHRLNEAGINLTMEAISQFSLGGAVGKAHLAKAIVHIGGAKNVTHAYEAYLAKTSPFFIERESVRPPEAIRAIVEAGGVASLAHPGKSEHVFEVITDLQRHGLGAVEVYHRIHSVQTVQRLIRFANRNGLLITGGSDCHGPYEDSPPSMGSLKVPLQVVENLRRQSKAASELVSVPVQTSKL